MKRLAQSVVVFVVSVACLGFFVVGPAQAQSGKIQGTITDAETGEAMPGVNIQIVGTTKGATTNAQGFYQIVGVEPGTHTLRATFVGYAAKTVEGVEVNVDLTTTVDIEMQEQTQELQEVTVRAQEEVVKKDISANVVNLNQEAMENVPVASIESMVGLTAGVTGLSVRGSGSDELAMRVDGASMRQGRTNSPFTGISFTGVQQVQVQTGGFNAEYGNVRSGLINVVTAEGPRNRYTIDVLSRYSSPQQQYFGEGPAQDPFYNYNWTNLYDKDAQPDKWEKNQRVMMEGTRAGCQDSPSNAPDLNCVLNQWERADLSDWDGYERYMRDAIGDDDPEFDDLTTDHAKAVFDWFHRRSLEPVMPDYVIDGSFGGPMPVVSDYLGDLRFHMSYRQDNTAFPVPTLERLSNLNRTGRLKLTSDVSTGMKLQLQGMLGKEYGINSDFYGESPMHSAEVPRFPWSESNSYMINKLADEGPNGFWGGNWNESTPQENTHLMLGGTLTHTINQNTFYELRVQRMSTDYLTGENVPRDTSVVRMLDGYTLNEMPMHLGVRGSSPWPGGLNAGWAGNHCRQHCGESRDSSFSTVWTAEFDITSQLASYSQLKAGIDYNYQSFRVRHGNYENYGPGDHFREWRYFEEHTFNYNRSPQQGAAYIQDKLEFEGLVANLGLRADFFDPNTQWYEYDPFTKYFSTAFSDQLDTAVEKERTGRQFALSPRLGVSFPITANSKLYLNYGHFRQLLQPDNLFSLYFAHGSAPNEVRFIGNPNHPMPLTIAYELGFEQNIANQYLLRITGYYKALENQPRNVTYTNIGETVNYDKPLPLNYEDIRGLEVSLRKNVGQWIRGFANFSFMVQKSGNFGYGARYENTAQMASFINRSIGLQSRPVPQPYARANVEFLTPVDFGPQFGMLNPLGDWHLSLLGTWRAGEVFTWSGGGTSGLSGVRDNVRWKDYWMLDGRVSKNISTPMGRLQLFVDVSNVLNIRYLYRNALTSGQGDFPFENYLQSLHLPEDTFEELPSDPYGFVYGNDRPGDYKEPGTEFVPIVVVNTTDEINVFREDPLYYESETETYKRAEYNENSGEWDVSRADQQFVDQVVENKQYINMPGQTWNRFLNPRQWTFGLRITL